MATRTPRNSLPVALQGNMMVKVAGVLPSSLFVAERFAYYGLSGNLITYLTNELEQPMATAIRNVNTWVGVSAIFPVLGAFIADSYLGRFKTVLVSTTFFLVGMVVLTLSVSVVPGGDRGVVFFVGLYIIAVGEGGHRPCAQTFAADQFDEDSPEEKAAKSSFFNWWYLGIVVGASSAILVVIYVQDNVGWAAGLGMLAGALVVAISIFLLGIKRYRRQAPIGSPFTAVVQVLVAAVRKRRVTQTLCAPAVFLEPTTSTAAAAAGGARAHDIEGQPKAPSLAPTNQFRFLDKAKFIDELDASSKSRNPWRLCSQNQVEEVKLVVRLIPIWVSCLMFTATIVQTHTFFIKQASTLVRSIGPNFHVPPASLQSLSGFTILVCIPIYDRLLVPLARKWTGHPSGITMLQRIGIGLFLSAADMVVAALVEAKRLHIATHHGFIDTPKATLPMSLWWLLPQYMISGVADVFAIVGLQELFYDQMPASMRSVGAAAHISLIGVGSFLNTAVMSLVEAISSRHGSGGGNWVGDNINRAHIDYFYWVLAALNGLSLCFFLWIAKAFVYKKVEEGEDTPQSS
ncbi:hypothetical protein Tsubulata_008464 [Turnera subulata]|uniref:Uncharacterized protein n=1 Tax=Turnera subulata TaxID=218843 RepID=A0A9Q0JLK3_9ROSI|nr:hypothetical protein Tsubulata_008464 [Turnera subulata]